MRNRLKNHFIINCDYKDHKYNLTLKSKQDKNETTFEISPKYIESFRRELLRKMYRLNPYLGNEDIQIHFGCCECVGDKKEPLAHFIHRFSKKGPILLPLKFQRILIQRALSKTTLEQPKDITKKPIRRHVAYFTYAHTKDNVFHAIIFLSKPKEFNRTEGTKIAIGRIRFLQKTIDNEFSPKAFDRFRQSCHVVDFSKITEEQFNAHPNYLQWKKALD